MTDELRPFAATDLDDASELLASHLRRIRTRLPFLPGSVESPSAARTHLGELLQEASGVVSYQGRSMDGFLLAKPDVGWNERIMRMPLGGHALAEHAGIETFREMYAAASPDWLRDGFFTHAADTISEEKSTSEALFSLAFGREISMGFREVGEDRPAAAGVEVHQAGPESIDTVVELMTGLSRHNSEPPLYRPYAAIPDRKPSLTKRLLNLMSDDDHSFWLAFVQGQPAGLFILTPPEADERVVSPENCTYIWIAFVRQNLRAGGVGTALLEAALDWANQRGYASCTVGWFSANISGSCFWQKQGFPAFAHRLVRRLDGRIAWASGESATLRST